MVSVLSRAQDGMLAKWWWSVDRWGLAGIIFLMVLGLIMGLAASPSIAQQKGLPEYFFFQRQLIFAFLGLFVMLVCSLLSPVGVRRLGYALLGIFGLALILTLLTGSEIKGARRWLNLGFLSLQPSEFIKPALIIISADLMSRTQKVWGRVDPTLVSLMGLVACALLLMMQPDIGQMVLISSAWVGLLFLSGVRLVWAGLMLPVGGLVISFAYLMFDHVQKRIDAFLDPVHVGNFQVNRALDAAAHGGWFGVGPGEGILKLSLPDAHTDFIFAVALEEFGFLACMLIVGSFALIVLRSVYRASSTQGVFTQLAVGGLSLLIGLQAFLNMAVNLGMLPATGMTLPFISYGGTSLLASAISVGLLLALTRRRPGFVEPI